MPFPKIASGIARGGELFGDGRGLFRQVNIVHMISGGGGIAAGLQRGAAGTAKGIGRIGAFVADTFCSHFVQIRSGVEFLTIGPD